MKIIPKLTAALMAGTCIILGVNGWLRVRRERRFFEADRIRDHEIVGRSLEAAASAVWKYDGRDAAIHAIDAVSRHSNTLGIRWIPRTETPGLDVGSVWRTYVPLDVDGVRRGFIELSEPPTAEDRFVRNAVSDTVAMTLALAVVSALLAFLMGQWLVGTPVRLLSEKARRIGRGDFSGPVALQQHDELADLAREINAMCDRLATTIDHLRHADRLSTVGKLASGVAHELGTPLNVVGARAKMVSAGETSPEESREYAAIIVGATDRMTATIRQLLQFARRDTSQKAPTDLRKLAAESAELLRPLATQAHVDLVLAPGAEDATADVDGGQIQQVITNLVMNAVQAMPKGGKVELSLTTEHLEPPAELHKPAASYLRLRVEDGGEGITPENLQHIFEPFFTTKDVGAGTGLGLAVTYGIIRDHGGWIAVDSVVGEGTTFSVYLPASGTA